MKTRREFLKLTTLSGAALLLPWQIGTKKAFGAPLRGGTLPPDLISKYASPLAIPPAMPRSARLSVARAGLVDYYEIAVRQFRQQILPAGLPLTTVWSYGSANHPSSFFYPAFTIEAKVQQALRVKWINDLKDPSTGRFLPHLLPVDQTLHWANPPGGETGRDMHTMNPAPYAGPVPIVTHLHGAHATQDSDGFPEAWYLPAANDIPSGYAREGSFYAQFKEEFADRWGTEWEAGSAVFQYENDQPATTLWYHDHSLGMTRNNVYAGPAGFYLLRGGPGNGISQVLPGPAPAQGDPPGKRYYEIPIVIQDRSFNLDGSLFYPDSRLFFDEFAGPYVPGSDIAPIWNPEFFANTMVVNGRTWPRLEVEPRRYRFRFLNGCNSRFLILKLVGDPLVARPGGAALPFWQIGGDGGFLAAPVEQPSLLVAPAERMDVIVDFTGLSEGTEIYLINEGPDEPFGGGVPETDFPAADPGTTGQVMKFVVGRLLSRDNSISPERLALPAVRRLKESRRMRQLSLNERDSEVLSDVGPRVALLGRITSQTNEPLGWADDITETPRLGDTEIWEFHNFTEDAHPIHVHMVQFEVLGRQPFGGECRPAEPWETGPKDTVIAFPLEITRVKATFDRPGRFVWHCHILEHEDNEMMRPYVVKA